MKPEAPTSTMPYTSLGVFQDPVMLTWAGGLFVAHLVLQFLFGAIKSPLQANPGAAAHRG